MVASMPEKLSWNTGSHTKYKGLEKFFDGQAYKFTQGIDFEIKPANFGSLIRRRAEQAGFRSSCLVRGQHLFFQTLGPVEKKV